MNFFISLSIPLIFLLAGSITMAFPLSSGNAEKEVAELFKKTELIPDIRIIPADEGRFVAELIFNIGDRWGRNGFAREIAKDAVERLFKSGLPIAQGIVKVYCHRMEILHLAISMNQAKQIRWENSSNPSQFFDMLQSCIHWGKRPEDSTYVIEQGRITKPSPVVAFPSAL